MCYKIFSAPNIFSRSKCMNIFSDWLDPHPRQPVVRDKRSCGTRNRPYRVSSMFMSSCWYHHVHIIKVIHHHSNGRYYINVEWDILRVPAERHVKVYPCCPEPYPGHKMAMIQVSILQITITVFWKARIENWVLCFRCQLTKSQTNFAKRGQIWSSLWHLSLNVYQLGKWLFTQLKNVCFDWNQENQTAFNLNFHSPPLSAKAA